MQRLHQLLFVLSFLGLCWLGMMAVHELGHILGAVITGGTVQRVVLHPLSISRTDVLPNPHPTIVVWLGPLVGSLLPLGICTLIPSQQLLLKKLLQYFTGFCLIANGAYLAAGSIDLIGDCGEMHRTGTPTWVIVSYGVLALIAGMLIWHRLGSLKTFVSEPALVPRRVIYGLAVLCVTVCLASVSLSS